VGAASCSGGLGFQAMVESEDDRTGFLAELDRRCAKPASSMAMPVLL
jgi:hypothetical protein